MIEEHEEGEYIGIQKARQSIWLVGDGGRVTD